MGVLIRRLDGAESYTIGYGLNDALRDTVESVLDPGPWHTAIMAMLDDERGAVLGVPTSNATDVTIEQSRMITHEVRNALVPVRLHIEDMLSADIPPTVRPRAEAALRGVVRVLEFVRQMVSLAEVMSEPATSAELGALLDEARDQTEGADRVEIVKGPVPVRVHVPRTRLVTALANVIRNALQSASPSPPVRVSRQRFPKFVRVLVDDGGPGIAGPDRARVFDDGFTTKPSGSGFGLAYVKHVIENEVRGKVWCEASDLGGARFVLEIPTSSES